jgi:(heptosyl)LPS beta-1,4-glucosyltransferase
MPRVSVTIICKDEADRIAAAVASAAWADEVVVLDSGSTDGTPDLARQAGATVHVEAWRGYGAQKNRAAELARNRWIFNLDADERIDARTAAAIQALAEQPAHRVYAVRRRNHLGAVPIRRWPWSWDRQRRFYDREATAFSAVPLHESLTDAGPVGILPGVLEHFTYRDAADHERRLVAYARLWAERARGEGRRISALKRVGDPAVTFVRHWLLRGYLLGGRQGWRLSCAAARGVALRYRFLAHAPPVEGPR